MQVIRIQSYRIIPIMANAYVYSYQYVACLRCEYSDIMENIQPIYCVESIYCMLTHHALALEE